MIHTISIDWDFFVPEDPMWDFGHRESRMFLNLMWKMRGADYLKKIKTTGREKGFWARLRKKIDIGSATVGVSESHAVLTPTALSECRRLILFDAHHDCFSTQEEGFTCCGDWARQWLECDKNRRLTWVRPAWVDPRPPKDLAARIDVFDEDSFDGADMKMASFIHICRSGCWTPPWLDGKFIKFVRQVHPSPTILQDGDWDAMKERWAAEDYKEVRNLTEARSAM